MFLCISVSTPLKCPLSDGSFYYLTNFSDPSFHGVTTLKRAQNLNHPAPRVSELSASLCHTGRRRGVLGHTLNTLRHVVTKKSHNVLSKFTILCWVTLIAILSRKWPAGRRLDTPAWHPVTALLSPPSCTLLYVLSWPHVHETNCKPLFFWCIFLSLLKSCFQAYSLAPVNFYKSSQQVWTFLC